eukprot:TRINITY_DN4082_c0_g1_i1.p1 TRINITY_DN4082_c0_g1~~TRINITY_DN4082_c0_g1_i1.p1  ORF type:complete len:1550 (+),score=246.50 TRINITY_DN4082_c0_g1_i1:43-4692(+)
MGKFFQILTGYPPNGKLRYCAVTVEWEGREAVSREMELLAYSARIDIPCDEMPATVYISYQFVTVCSDGLKKTEPRKVAVQSSFFWDCLSLFDNVFEGIASNANAILAITCEPKCVLRYLTKSLFNEEGISSDVLPLGLLSDWSRMELCPILEHLSDEMCSPEVVRLIAKWTSNILLNDDIPDDLGYYPRHCLQLCVKQPTGDINWMGSKEQLLTYFRAPKECEEKTFFSMKGIEEEVFIKLTIKYPLLVPMLLTVAPEELDSYSVGELGVQRELLLPSLCCACEEMSSPTVANIVMGVVHSHLSKLLPGVSGSQKVLLRRLAEAFTNSKHIEPDVVITLLQNHFSKELQASEVNNFQQQILSRLELQEQVIIIYKCWKQNLDISKMTSASSSLAELILNNSSSEWTDDLVFVNSICVGSPVSFLSDCLNNGALNRFVPSTLVKVFEHYLNEDKLNETGLNDAVSIYHRLFDDHPGDTATDKHVDDKNAESTLQTNENQSVDSAAVVLPETSSLDASSEASMFSHLEQLFQDLRNRIQNRTGMIIADKAPVPKITDLEYQKLLHENLKLQFYWPELESLIKEHHALQEKIIKVRKQYTALLKVITFPKNVVEVISKQQAATGKVIDSDVCTHLELKKLFEGFWKYKKWYKVLDGMPLLLEIKNQNHSVMFPSSIFDTEKAPETLLSEYVDYLIKGRNDLLIDAVEDKVIYKERLAWLHEDILNFVVTVVGGHKENIPILLKHSQNISSLQSLNDWLFLQHKQEPSTSLPKTYDMSYAASLQIISLQRVIGFFIEEGFNPSLAAVYTNKKKLLPVIALLRKYFPHRDRFVSFLSVALDYTAQNPDLQHIVRELRKVHQYRVTNLNIDLPMVSDTLPSQLDIIADLILDLRNAGGRDMRTLSAVTKSFAVIKTSSNKLNLEISDVLSLQGAKLEQGSMKYIEWEEFMTTITFGYTNLEDKHAKEKNEASFFLDTAKKAATAFLNARKAGQPKACGRFFSDELDTLSKLNTFTECWVLALSKWTEEVERIQRDNPIMINVPMEVLRNKRNTWSPFTISGLCSLPQPFIFTPSDCRVNVLNGAQQVRIKDIRCPYTTMVKAFASVNAKLQRWSLLLGHRTTTAEDVTLFIKRIKHTPTTVYGCINLSHLTYSLQKHLLTEVEGLAGKTRIFFTDGVNHANEFIKNTVIEDIAVDQNTYIPTAHVITGAVGSGKTRYVKKLRKKGCKIVTVSATMTDDAFTNIRGNKIIIRVGGSVVNTTEVDRVLFQVLFLNCLVDSSSYAHSFEGTIFVEITKSSELLKLCKTTPVPVWDISNTGIPTLPNRLSEILESLLGKGKGLPMTKWCVLKGLFTHHPPSKNHGPMITEWVMQKTVTNNKYPFCTAYSGHDLVEAYRCQAKPPNFPNFKWSKELVELMLQLDISYHCRLPIILEGETGCGKTFLVKCWCDLRKCSLKIITIHGGYDMHRIERTVKEVTALAFQKWQHNKTRTVVLLDEMNTTPAVDLLKELVCDFRLHGETLAVGGLFEYVTFVGAINPDRKRTQKELERYRHQGLQ